MGNQDKCILIIQKITLQPCNMFFVQIVGRLVQKKDIRFFQKKFTKENFCSLTTTQVCYVTIQAQIQKSQRPGYFFHLGIDHIKIMKCQLILNSTQFFHQGIHFIFAGRSQKITDLIHSLFLLKKGIKRRFQYFLNGHSFFQNSVLVKITGTNIFRPFYFTFIRHQFPGDNTHKSRFSFTVGTNKSNMLSFKKSEGNIGKDSSVTKPMCQMFYI